jgi:BirA family biotin operon repressor/biotin-[acetyl-CoA-carboxylase] ligase
MSEGRGTHGRTWHAPAGGLYLSFLLRRAIDPQRLTLAIGNAVADVLEVAGAEPQLKWVNDVLVDGSKIAGILVEAESTGDTIDQLRVGIGINVNGTSAAWPQPLNEQSTTLQDVLSAEACIEDLESYLLQTIDTWLRRLETDADAIVTAWRGRDALLGKVIGFDPDGDFCAKVMGKAAGIDDDGRLLIDVDGVIEAHATGCVCSTK